MGTWFYLILFNCLIFNINSFFPVLSVTRDFWARMHPTLPPTIIECRRLVQPGILCFAAVFLSFIYFIYYLLLFRRIGNLPNR